ncbi:MAG: thiamine-phosphate pyrophosphorylase [Chitinivibrionales bacterium]
MHFGSPLLSEEEKSAVFRILDVNCNRLREALRVLEEYVRFVVTAPETATILKKLRHSLKLFEDECNRSNLVISRDTQTDPFAQETKPEEMMRTSLEDVLVANCKRAQEAARTLEEYVKITKFASAAAHAKRLRFSLYEAEKKLMEHVGNG